LFEAERERMKGGKRERAGRKRVNLDLEQVEKLAAIQCTEAEIASVLGVSERTIDRRKHHPDFAEAIARGKARGRVSLRRSLWALAQKGNPAGNIFLAKNLLGYKDYFTNEHSGPDGGPIQIGPAPELGELSVDELKQLTVLVGKASPARKA
jgi:hypothetical protein